MASKKSKKKASKKAATKPMAKEVQRTPVAPTTEHGRLAGVTGSLSQQRADIAALVNKINSKGGKSDRKLVTLAADATSNAWLRRPSGIMQLDIDTAGGLPAQEMTTIGGPGNSGKSTLLYHYYAQHQRIYGERSVIGATHSEGTIDYVQARRCGWIVPFPEEEIEALQASRKEQGFPLLTKAEVAELRREVGTNVIVGVDTMEALMDRNLEMLRSNRFGIIGIDSYEGLLPAAEAALDSLEEYAQQALRANCITRFCQRYNEIKGSPRHFTSLVFTLQVRSNRKKMEASTFMQKYIKDYTEDKAAYALQHARAMHISVDSGSKIEEGTKDKKVARGKAFTWKITKGKSGAHDNVHGETPYYYDERCFNLNSTLLVAGLRYGVIQEQGGYLTFYRNGEPDGYLYQIPGKEEFLQALQGDFEAAMGLRWEICRVANVSPICR